MVAWCTLDPLWPVTVSVKVPRTVLPPALMARFEVPGATTELGVKLAVAPEGSPLSERLTVPAKPPIEETPTV